MARRKSIISKQHYANGFATEQSGAIDDAIKHYQKATASDPTNTQAWNRLMILFRKSRTGLQEVKLIKSAIAQYQKARTANHELWLKNNHHKAASSRALAKVLGMLEDNGLPKADEPILEKWETRLYLLEYRIKNARKKKTTAKKKIKLNKRTTHR